MKLRDYQEEALNKILEYKRGLVVLPTGAGKTIIGIALLQYLFREYGTVNYYILVPTRALVFQWTMKLEKAGIPVRSNSVLTYPSFIKLVNKKGPTKVFSSSQTLEGYLKGKSGKVNVIIIDEAHHAHIESKLWQAISKVPADYIVGFTATPNPFRTYELPVIYEKTIADLFPYLADFNLHKVPVELDKYDKEQFEEAVRELGYVMDAIERARKRGDTERLLQLEERRDEILGILPGFVALDDNVIRTTIDIAAKLSGKTLIKTNRVLAAEVIEQGLIMLYGVKKDKIFLYRGKSQLAELYKGKWEYLITVKALSEGIDIPDINNVILSSYDYSHLLSVVQTIGRALRKSLTKHRAEIYVLVPNLEQYEKAFERLKKYMGQVS